MNSGKINDWLQVVGLFGVIASLLFVGLQMKQDREVAQSAVSQARTELNVQFILGIAENPNSASALEKLNSGQADQMTFAERRTIGLHSAANLFIFENIQYQYESGFIPESRWQGTLNAIRRVLRSSPGLRVRYESGPQQWSKSFQDVMDMLIAEIDAEAAQ